jgi:hypothetical protein
VTAIDVKDTLMLPALAMVNDCAPEVAPTGSVPNASEAALNFTTGVVAELPIPLSVTSCGDPVALSATLTVADFPLPETGVKVTDTVQLAPGARVDPQVLVSAKSSACTPVTAIDVNATLALLALVIVTVWALDAAPTGSVPKASKVALNFTTGVVGSEPVPPSATLCGEPAVLSTALTLADFPPAETGANVTDTAQVAPAARLVPQVSASAKSSACTPVTLIDVNDTLVLLTLAIVNVLALDGVPTVWLPNASEVGVRIRAGPLEIARFMAAPAATALPAAGVSLTTEPVGTVTLGTLVRVPTVNPAWVTAAVAAA